MNKKFVYQVGNNKKGIKFSNCTKYCSRAPWGWSHRWTETCRGNFTKMFL